ncbi:MAG: esterase-like activity of phytase family protein [Gammaproteobacteria bacterium]|nr:esterase-like activity of phytase family protein [Gammaproteobacteria bacterium]
MLAGLLLAAAATAVEVGEPLKFSKTHPDGTVYMQVRLLGALRLAKTEVDGYGLRQLSALAWDADAGVLYALSDDGYIAHLQPQFDNGMLAGIDFVAAWPLLEADGTPVQGERADSEGLAIENGRNGIAGDAVLLVSYEVHPRLLRYTPDGRQIEALALPAPLADMDAYADDNEGLEAVALHPRLGILVAPERRLRGDHSGTLPIFALDGRQWRYTPIDPDHSALVGMDVTPDGVLLVVERRYNSLFSPVIFSVRRLAPGDEPGTPPVADVARFDSTGDFRIDNFETIARHDGNRYFMVSDDNRSAIQRTVLIYFEILDDPAATAGEN